MLYPKRCHPSPMRVAVGCLLTVLALSMNQEADARPGSCPQFEQALADRGLPVQFFSTRMWGESKCDPLAVNFNRRTRDASLGLLMHNLYDPGMAAAYVAAGFPYPVLLTADGNLNATVWRYNQCGTGPWIKTRHGYRCTPPKIPAQYV